EKIRGLFTGSRAALFLGGAASVIKPLPCNSVNSFCRKYQPFSAQRTWINLNMAKVNSCFKGTFVFFNILFGIGGGILLVLGILTQAFYHGTEEFGSMMVGVIGLCVMGVITMTIAFLGAYGAYKEKKWALIVFSAIMALGFIGLLRVAIPMMIARPQVKTQLEEQLQQAIPLDEASPEMRKAADKVQEQLGCCGLFTGYQDWGSHVPASCHCPEELQGTDRCVRTKSSELEFMRPRSFLERLSNHSGVLVYKEPCISLIEAVLDKVFTISLVVIFGFAFMALIGLMMSLVLIWHIKGHHIPAPVPFTVNSGAPKYVQLHNAS
ncbi:hypothetical protein GJAV_G00157010, partial [Gymnothorax javanicus]